jgi:hypothetical protein
MESMQQALTQKLCEPFLPAGGREVKRRPPVPILCRRLGSLGQEVGRDIHAPAHCSAMQRAPPLRRNSQLVDVSVVVLDQELDLLDGSDMDKRRQEPTACWHAHKV